MTSERRHACSQQGCNVHETGQCLEGLDPASCSHHKWIDAGLDETVGKEMYSEDDETPEQGSQTSSVRDLHHGKAMDLQEASIISVSGPSQLVVLAGERKSGKTTLLASIYEKFLRGPFCDLLFAGSLTLPGFEQRCFNARMDCGRERAHTPHTSLDAGFRILHLCLVHQELGHRWHLLFGDLAGEWYRVARQSSDDARALGYLRRADRFCLLLDGEKLADVQKRHGEVDDAEGTLRSLLEADSLRPHSCLDVTCSKWDLVYRDEAASKFVDHAFGRIHNAFKQDFAELEFYRTAARPDEASERVPFGFGLDILLARWASPVPPMNRVETPLPDAQPFDRECNRFARRYPPRRKQ